MDSKSELLATYKVGFSLKKQCENHNNNNQDKYSEDDHRNVGSQLDFAIHIREMETRWSPV